MGEFLEFFKEPLCQWFTVQGWTWWANHCESLIDTGFLAVLVGLLATFGKRIPVSIWHWFRSRQAARILRPYFTHSKVQEYTRYFIPTRVQANSPAALSKFDKLEPSQDYLEFFIDRVFRKEGEDDRFHILLGGAGMGKTAFMINLLIKYRLRWKPFGKKLPIKLIPLYEPEVLKVVENLPDQQDTILLLDALDEDPKAHENIQQRLKDIVQATRNFRCVVITCRAQFFESEADEPTFTEIPIGGGGHFEFDKQFVSPFSDKEIEDYIQKRFPFYKSRKRKAAKTIISNYRDVMVRPMILSYIDDLLVPGKSYKLRFEVYESIIDAWIERESEKPSVKPGEKAFFKSQLYQFSGKVAERIYQKYLEGKEMKMESEEFQQLKEEYGISLDETEMKGRTLLNRNSKGQFQFAHKSILEYFLALQAYEGKLDPEFSEEFDQANQFYREMITIPQMVSIKGGTFKMGGKNKDEKPIHEVSLSDFEIAKYPITQRQWEAVMGANPSHFSSNPDHPVENVSWNDCQVFLNKLNEQTGLHFRLPTEAEWEYAARGGGETEGFTYAGSNDPDAVAWYDKNAGGKTHPVGQKLPNELGLYDMSGNVWEWCSDWYGDYPSGAQINPKGPSSGSFRVSRGGGWCYGASYLRVALRNSNVPDRRYNSLGFRPARTP